MEVPLAWFVDRLQLVSRWLPSFMLGIQDSQSQTCPSCHDFLFQVGQPRHCQATYLGPKAPRRRNVWGPSMLWNGAGFDVMFVFVDGRWAPALFVDASCWLLSFPPGWCCRPLLSDVSYHDDMMIILMMICHGDVDAGPLLLPAQFQGEPWAKDGPGQEMFLWWRCLQLGRRRHHSHISRWWFSSPSLVWRWCCPHL